MKTKCLQSKLHPKIKDCFKRETVKDITELYQNVFES